MDRPAGMVTAGHENDIMTLDRHGFVQRAVIGIDALHPKTLIRIEPVIVSFFEISDTRIVVFVMAMARIGRPVPFRCEDLGDQQAVTIVLVLHGDVVDPPLVGGLAARRERNAIGSDATGLVTTLPGAEQTAMVQSVVAIASQALSLGR